MITGCNAAVLSGDFEDEIRGIIADPPRISTLGQVLLIAQDHYGEWWDETDPEIRWLIGSKTEWMHSLNDRVEELFYASRGCRSCSADLH